MHIAFLGSYEKYLLIFFVGCIITVPLLTKYDQLIQAIIEATNFSPSFIIRKMASFFSTLRCGLAAAAVKIGFFLTRTWERK